MAGWSGLRMPARGSAPVVYPTAREPVTRRQRLLKHVSQPGLTLALAMLWTALSPSLLPRTWWMTAVSVGLSLVWGYALGDLGGRVAAWFARRVDLQVVVNARADWGLRLAWDLLLLLVTARVWWWSVKEQRGNAELVGLTSGGNLSQLTGVLAGVVLAVLVVALVRGLLVLWRGMRHLARRVLPAVVAPVVATAVLVGLLVWFSEGVVYRRAMDAALGSAARLNSQTAEGRVPPTEPERSGSSASTQTWASLGRDGQVMVADGPRRTDIEEVTGEPALEPIRVYAGRQENTTLDQAVEAVLAELDRTDAWEREVVHVTTATGTGFVQNWSVGAVEYLTGGDVATASLQYSYFSSALAYVTDRTTPPQAGRRLFEAVHARIEEMPEAERPKLVVSGESLGSYGGQGAFDSAEDMLATVDGAVWTGTPRFTPLWASLTGARRPGSPEIAPVVDNGRHVRFVTRPEELDHDFYGAPYVDWEEPRVVYGQHASDPIVWWDPSLLLEEPDWMRERVGRDVPSELRWAPWISFWQIGVDMPLSVSTPGGHGHHYFEEVVPYWAAVLGQEWTGERIEKVQAAVREDFRPR